MAKALEGLLVVSLEQAVAAPYCSAKLADAGARVIKIERAEGDFARAYDGAVRGQSSYFVWLNRGKQSLVADIKQSEDAALLHRLIAKADIFIQNLAPGAAERSGFGSETLRARHPRLITVDISGYGETGEYATMKAYDLLVQAEAGLAMVTGHPAGPGRVGVSIADIGCGMNAYAGVLEALIERGLTNHGKALQVSLFDAVADWMNVPLLYFEGTGQVPARMGLAHPSICPYGAFATQDNALILISIQNEREWATFCALFLDAPDLPKQPGFESNNIRVANRALVDQRVSQSFIRLTRDQAATRLRASNTAYGFVNDLAALAQHPALRRTSVALPDGSMAEIVAPAVVHVGEAVSLGAVPAVGAHDVQIRAEFAE